MRALLAILGLAATAVVVVDVDVRGPRLGPGPAATGDEASLRVETLVSGLDTPWDLARGPDGAIWVTERPGRISRVDPETGELTVIGELEVTERGESGLMGLAFHPRFDAEPWVYAAHSYGSIGNRLVRMRYDGARLSPPETLLDELPGAGNHNGSRLAVGPDGYLYMTTGDAGRAGRAQDFGSLAGKVLRLTLEGRPAPGNPFESEIFSYGHRNAQGLVFHPRLGHLYSTEHGPSDNDELNRILRGGDYGWPRVHGRCDGDTRGELEYCGEYDVVEPLEAWTPTVGIAGLDAYEADLIPGWRGSLLATSLRGGTLFRLRLSEDGLRVVEREALLRGEYGRLRDVLVGPDGAVYVATSNRDGRGNPDPEDDRILKITP